MSEGSSVESNIDEFHRIITDLGNVKVTISDEDQAILLLMSLPKQFDQLRHTLKYGKSELTLEEVTGAIHSMQLELGAKEKTGKTAGEGLYVQTRGRLKNRGTSFSFKKKERSMSRTKPRKMVCWICEKEGHFKRDCPKRNNGKSIQPFLEKGETSAVSGNEQQADVLVVQGDLEAREAQSSGVEEGCFDRKNNDSLDFSKLWILDTGCTFHMTPRREWFDVLEEITGGTVRMANNAVSQVKGIGEISIKTNDGGCVKLTKVRYVPDFSRNLISLGTLESQGCSFSSENGLLKVKKGCRTILKAERNESLYILNGCSETNEVNAVSGGDKTKLWHSRLGHMSLKGMTVLKKKGYLKETDISELDFCEDCVVGKMHRVSFNTGLHVSKQPLDYIHADLWGSPHVPKSLGGCQYFLSIIDDHSRKVWVMFLKTKGETFQKFEEWSTLVENQSGRSIKKLRTDNGLEFCNNEFKVFCKRKGIARHKTVAYTPQQNGVAERMNRTILEKVRSLLSEAGLEKKFWAEAANTAVYLINRSPSTAIDCKIPEEVWSERELSYEHLKRFGCICYIHADDGKLNPRARKGCFLGYPTGVKGYKVWLLEEQKSVISRNVVFNEMLCFKDLRHETSEQVYTDSGSSRVILDVKNDENVVSGGVISESTELEDEDDISEDSESYQEGEDATDSVSGLENYLLARDRARRIRKIPEKLREGSCSSVSFLVSEDGGSAEPTDLKSVLNDKNKKDWLAAMKEEMDSLRRNNTWSIVKKPANRRIIGCKWIFTRKPGIPGLEPPRFKARLVAKGFSQKEGVDYNEIFAPVVKHVSIRLLMAIVVQENLELEQLDVKTAFLHGELEEEIFMREPEGYESSKDGNLVCLLKKSLYGLKQSPRQWNQKFNNFMIRIGFTRSEFDSCAYVKQDSEGNYIYLLLYVDDMLVAAKKTQEISDLKNKLSSEFEMKHLGNARRILGIDIVRNRSAGELKLSQEVYLSKVLEKFKMDAAKPVQTQMGAHFKLKAATEEQLECEEDYMKKVPYSSVVGSLMYSMIGTRPDLAFPVGVVSRFMSKPLKEHWSALKWVLRYIKGSLSLKLSYKQSTDFRLWGYCDADFASDLDRRRSITGFTFVVGGCAISWKSGLQKVVALSTTEAEYMSLTEAVKEATWLKGLLSEFGYKQEVVEIMCDSQSAMALSKNNVHHERTKHIDVRLHYIRDMIAEGKIKVTKVHTSVNAADILTKALPTSKLRELLGLLGISEE